MIVNIFEYATNNYSTTQLATIMLGNTDSLSWNTVFDSIVSQLLPNGGTIYFPSFFRSNAQGGQDYSTPYLLRRPLVINATNTPINIVGDDVGSHSVLKFVKNSDYGIQVTGTGNISIKRISIHGDGKILNDGIFVAANTKISIYDTEVHHCKKNGIRIGSHTVGWYMNTVYCYENTGTGFFIEGKNGVGIALNAFNNLGKAHIVDAGGANTLIGCHVKDNNSPGINPYYITEPDSMLVGCYYETNTSANTPILAKNSMWWGGQMTDGVLGSGTILNRNTFYNQASGTGADATRQGGMRFENVSNPANIVSFTAGGSPAGSIFEFDAQEDNMVLPFSLLGGAITGLPDFLFLPDIWSKLLTTVSENTPLHAQIMDLNLSIHKLEAITPISAENQNNITALKAQIEALKAKPDYDTELQLVEDNAAIYADYLTIKEAINRLKAAIVTTTNPTDIKNLQQQITTLSTDLANKEQQLLLTTTALTGKWRLKYRPDIPTTNKNHYYRNWYRLVYDISLMGIELEDAHLTALAFSSINSETDAEKSGMIAFPNGYYMGNQNQPSGHPIYIGESATIPTTTDAQLGDRYFNTAPALTDPQNCIGWIYTSIGWEKFGKIVIE